MIDGERFVLKHLHPDDDWTMRGFGDLGCRPVAVWTSGLLDALPDASTTPWSGPPTGLGRNGWGGALLLRDVGEHLVPEGDDPLSLEQHRQLLDHLADAVGAFWEPDGHARSCCRSRAAGARSGRAGWRPRRRRAGPTPCRGSPHDGWARFARRAPGDVVDAGRRRCAHDLDPLVRRGAPHAR